MSGHRIAVLIDGGHLRVLTRRAGHQYVPEYIEKIAHACVDPDETMLRTLYYDCAPFVGEVKRPVTNTVQSFNGSDSWLKNLAAKDLFAVRRGVLKFRGWKPRNQPITQTPLTDADFDPSFEQKGVDMRIGLDVATFSANHSVDRLALVSGDTDCIPAMKHARKAGLQVILISLPNHRSAPELLWHSDYERRIAWPAP